MLRIIVVCFIAPNILKCIFIRRLAKLLSYRVYWTSTMAQIYDFLLRCIKKLLISTDEISVVHLNYRTVILILTILKFVLYVVLNYEKFQKFAFRALNCVLLSNSPNFKVFFIQPNKKINRNDNNQTWIILLENFLRQVRIIFSPKFNYSI